MLLAPPPLALPPTLPTASALAVSALDTLADPTAAPIATAFEVVTLTRDGAIIDVLEDEDPGRYVDVSYGWYAPNPPPPDRSPAASRGGGGAAAAGLAVASALLLHSLGRWAGGGA